MSMFCKDVERCQTNCSFLYVVLAGLCLKVVSQGFNQLITFAQYLACIVVGTMVLWRRRLGNAQHPAVPNFRHVRRHFRPLHGTQPYEQRMDSAPIGCKARRCASEMCFVGKIRSLNFSMGYMKLSREICLSLSLFLSFFFSLSLPLVTRIDVQALTVAFTYAICDSFLP